MVDPRGVLDRPRLGSTRCAGPVGPVYQVPHGFYLQFLSCFQHSTWYFLTLVFNLLLCDAFILFLICTCSFRSLLILQLALQPGKQTQCKRGRFPWCFAHPWYMPKHGRQARPTTKTHRPRPSVLSQLFLSIHLSCSYHIFQYLCLPHPHLLGSFGFITAPPSTLTCCVMECEETLLSLVNQIESFTVKHMFSI